MSEEMITLTPYSNGSPRYVKLSLVADHRDDSRDDLLYEIESLYNMIENTRDVLATTQNTLRKLERKERDRELLRSDFNKRHGLPKPRFEQEPNDGLCPHCNTEIIEMMADEGCPGGDWYSCCDVCEWHSEGDCDSKIKNGLTVQETVELKLMLSKFSQDMVNPNPSETTRMMRASNHKLYWKLRPIIDFLLIKGEDE